MLAVDTNLLIRYLANDEPAQSARARRLIDGGPIFVATTVMLETEWVLRRAYLYTRPELAKSLRDIVGLEHVTLEEYDLVTQAIEWFEAGMDFADALHLGKAGRCAAFVTFDKGFIRRGDKLGAVPVRAP
jgi:predicted nucleic-acid-binding protein